LPVDGRILHSEARPPSEGVSGAGGRSAGQHRSSHQGGRSTRPSRTS
jgi:hypothetical protein